MFQGQTQIKMRFNISVFWRFPPFDERGSLSKPGPTKPGTSKPHYTNSNPNTILIINP